MLSCPDAEVTWKTYCARWTRRRTTAASLPSHDAVQGSPQVTRQRQQTEAASRDRQKGSACLRLVSNALPDPWLGQILSACEAGLRQSQGLALGSATFQLLHFPHFNDVPESIV